MLCEVEPSADLFSLLFNLNQDRQSDWFYFGAKSGTAFLGSLPDSIKGWKNKYFFVSNSEGWGFNTKSGTPFTPSGSKAKENPTETDWFKRFKRFKKTALDKSFLSDRRLQECGLYLTLERNMPPRTLAERMLAISQADKSKKRGKEALIVKRRKLTKAADKATSVSVPSAHASLERIIKDVSGPVQEGNTTSSSSLPAISNSDTSIPDVPIVFPHTLPIGSGFDIQIPDRPSVFRSNEPARSEGNTSSGSGPVIHRKKGVTRMVDPNAGDSSAQGSGVKVLTHRRDNVLPVNVNAVRDSLRGWRQGYVKNHLNQINLEESCAHFQWSMASTVLWGDRVVAFCNQNNSEMKTRISQLEEENKKLSKNLLLKDAEITKVGEEKKLTSVELKESQKAYGSLKVEHENLRASLSLSEQAATALRLDLDKCRNEKDSITDENRRLSETISELNHEASIENELKKILQSKLKNAEGERDLLSEQLKAKEVLLSNAQNENMELEAKLAATEKRELSDDEIRRTTSEVYSILSYVHFVDPSVNFHRTPYDEVIEFYFAKCFVTEEQNKDPVAEEVRAEVSAAEKLNPGAIDGDCAAFVSEKDIAVLPPSTSGPCEIPECEKAISDPDPIYKAILAESKHSPENVGGGEKTDHDQKPILPGRDHEASTEDSPTIIEIEDDTPSGTFKVAYVVPSGGIAPVFPSGGGDPIVPCGRRDYEILKFVFTEADRITAPEADSGSRSSTVRRKEDPPEMRQLRSEIQELKAVQEKILHDKAKRSGEALEAKLRAQALQEYAAKYSNWDSV
ncbi:hypothetical protein J5N97_014070 [Dioscorea zingiberensis]|uniref:Uncharacterized protein n=1 Tax=Dioscorea zingiberensis TaxID=325984 RepID=A0A9D5CRY1_9LILI|nr:hypothetical protein J5N97_014070 [Dioscorea zingiberensis]